MTCLNWSPFIVLQLCGSQGLILNYQEAKIKMSTASSPMEISLLCLLRAVKSTSFWVKGPEFLGALTAHSEILEDLLLRIVQFSPCKKLKSPITVEMSTSL